MANIVIREILASDTVSDLVDKVNFNFDQLLLNGGGPAGPLGGSGPAGPLGPRGSIWFTANDIYNTSTTTTPDPPLVFPLWSGTTQKVNNIALPGYPQFSGDPNRYLPAAATVTGTYPENSFIIGTTGKTPRSGDLYLQETDDTFDSYSSLDGDIWEFNGIAETWTYTGVNIKGDAGAGGATGFTEWVRTNDASPSLNDFLRPEIITANDPVVRVVLGANSGTQAEDILDEAGEYSDNILTLFGSAPSIANPDAWRTQLSFTDEYSIQAPANSTYDYGRIFSNNNILHVQGFNNSGATVNNYDLRLTARSGMVQLQSIKVNSPAVTQTLLLNTDTRKFAITNGQLDISVPFNTPTVGYPSGYVVEHRLTDTYATLFIRHMGSAGVTTSFFNGSYVYNSTSGPMMQIYSSGGARSTLNLNYWAKDRVAIGYFGQSSNNNINGKLAINSGQTANYATSITYNDVAGIIVGDSWSRNSSITFTKAGSTEVGIIDNSIFVQSQINIGATGASATELVSFGTSTYNSLNTKSSVNIKEGVLAFNSFKPTSSGMRSMGSSLSEGNYLFGPGTFIRAQLGSPNNSDIDGSLVIVSNTVNNSTFNTDWSSAAVPFSVWAQNGSSPIDNMQVLVNTIQRTISSVKLANFLVRGSSIIGKLKYSTAQNTIYGHEDDLSNGNIIIGNSSGTTNDSPRIIATSDGNTLTTSRTNHTYISTPMFIGSMSFTQLNEITTATNTSRLSSTGAYVSYYPSYYAQTKIIHGKTDGSSTLGSIENPYNTGIGLEIESRYWAVSATNPIAITRTPVVRDNAGVAITGNRPFLITKRSASNTSDNSVILFEITPQGNTSIGQPVKFPDLAVAVSSTSSKTTTLTTNWATNLGNTNALNAQNAGKWFNISNASAVATPFTNRSLVIGQITGNASLPQFNYDQNTGFIRAGISIDTTGYVLAGNANSSVSDIYNSYTFNSDPENSTITTPVYLFKKNSSTYAAGVSNPLGIKPGQTIYDSNGPGTNVPSMIKGTDVIIEGGDMIYVTDYPNKSWYAGDVYISGGQIYKNTTALGGYGNAQVDLQGYDWGLFGNVFLGSRISNQSSSSYADNSVMRAGLVYVGYDFNDGTNVIDTTSNFHPKGQASLNVSASPTSTESSRDSTFQFSNGRALNIQRGDIVTNNQEAGWIEINLIDPQFLNQIGTSGGSSIFESENIFCYNGTNIGAKTYFPNSSTFGYNITPQWKIRYKVIGYTVHYIISLVALRWNVISSVANKGDIIIITNANNLFSTNPNNSLLPRPKLGWTSSYPAVGQTFSMPFNQESASFSGSGHMYLHQSPTDVNFPWGGVGLLSPITVTPLAVAYDWSQDRITIYKSGSSMFMSDTATDYSNQGVERYLASRYLIPLNGRNMGDSSNAAAGTQIPVDIYISGTYELDPQYWFK